MKIWVDRDKINQLSAMLNTLELETARLKKMVGEIKPESKATEAKPVIKPNPEPTFQCSVCGRTFTMNYLTGNIRPDVELSGFTNMARQGQKYTYLYCSMSCCEKLSAAYTRAKSDVAQTPAPGNEGRFTH